MSCQIFRNKMSVSEQELKDKEQMPPPRRSSTEGKPKESVSESDRNRDCEGEGEEGVSMEQKKAAMPAVVRTRQLRNCFQFQSPSDAVMSPFSQSLAKAIHHPAILSILSVRPSDITRTLFSFRKNKQKPKQLQDANNMDTAK